MFAVGVGGLGLAADIHPGDQRGVGGQLGLDAGQLIDLPGGRAVTLGQLGFELLEVEDCRVALFLELVQLVAECFRRVPGLEQGRAVLVQQLELVEEFLLAAVLPFGQRAGQAGGEVIEQAAGQVGLPVGPGIRSLAGPSQAGGQVT